MTSTALTQMSFNDVECNVPGERTLNDWRYELVGARRAERRARRRFWLPRLRRMRWAS